jgi:predicted  nucleic acid-binding Zn-ribbon protein
MARRLYVSTNEASYFSTRILNCDNKPPVEGEYSVGDVVISSVQENDVFGWVCVKAGNPGQWKVICDIVEVKNGIKNNKVNIDSLITRATAAENVIKGILATNVQQTNDINNINKNISTLENTVNNNNVELLKRVDANDKSISNINTQVDVAKKTLTTLAGQIANNTTNITNLNKTVNDNKAAADKSITDLNTVINKNAADAAKVAAQISQDLTSVKQFVGLVEGEQQGPTLQDEINNLKDEIGKVADEENPATGIRKELDDIRDIIGQNAEDGAEAATGLQKEINDLKTIVGQNAEDGAEAATGLQKEINDLKDFVGIGEVEEGEEQGTTLQSKIDDLNEEVETIKEDLLKYWVGTQAQYDALKEKEQGKLYIIIN